MIEVERFARCDPAPTPGTDRFAGGDDAGDTGSQRLVRGAVAVTGPTLPELPLLEARAVDAAVGAVRAPGLSPTALTGAIRAHASTGRDLALRRGAELGVSFEATPPPEGGWREGRTALLDHELGGLDHEASDGGIFVFRGDGLEFRGKVGGVSARRFHEESDSQESTSRQSHDEDTSGPIEREHSE